MIELGFNYERAQIFKIHDYGCNYGCVHFYCTYGEVIYKVLH